MMTAIHVQVTYFLLYSQFAYIFFFYPNVYIYLHIVIKLWCSKLLNLVHKFMMVNS